MVKRYRCFTECLLSVTGTARWELLAVSRGCITVKVEPSKQNQDSTLIYLGSRRGGIGRRAGLKIRCLSLLTKDSLGVSANMGALERQ